MIPSGVRSAVDELLEVIDESPTELPARQVAALCGTGHEVTIDCSRKRTVVYVEPARRVDIDRLTPREREVAMLVVGGFSNQQIALALSISLYTVKDHVHAILTKTALEHRGQLIVAWHGGTLHSNGAIGSTGR